MFLLTERSLWVDEGGMRGMPGGAIHDGESADVDEPFTAYTAETGQRRVVHVGPVGRPHCAMPATRSMYGGTDHAMRLAHRWTG